MIDNVLRVLLADDDEIDRELFETALESVKHQVTLEKVINGEHLMQYLHAHHDDLPDVLFLDLNMPRKNGFESLAEIKADPALRDLPIIIISTSLDMEIVRQLHTTGATYYTRKPGSFYTLVDTLQRALDLIASGKTAHPPFENFVLNDK